MIYTFKQMEDGVLGVIGRLVLHIVGLDPRREDEVAPTLPRNMVEITVLGIIHKCILASIENVQV